MQGRFGIGDGRDKPSIPLRHVMGKDKCVRLVASREPHFSGYPKSLISVRLFWCSGNRKPGLRLESGSQEDAVLLVLSTWVAS